MYNHLQSHIRNVPSPHVLSVFFQSGISESKSPARNKFTFSGRFMFEFVWDRTPRLGWALVVSHRVRSQGLGGSGRVGCSGMGWSSIGHGVVGLVG